MKLIPGNNNRDCMGASFAMATGTTLERVIDFCGHDGHEDGFENQEMVDYALSVGAAAITHTDDSVYTGFVPHYKIDLKDKIADNIGVIAYEEKNGKYHAVATDGKLVYDPRGITYGLDFLYKAIAGLKFFWQIEWITVAKPMQAGYNGSSA